MQTARYFKGRPIRAAASPVLIAVPFYKAEALVAPLVASLRACGDEIIAGNGRIVFYNDSPGHAPLAAALAQALRDIDGDLAWRLQENAENLGFVRTMNLAVEEAVRTGCDLLLLNSDTRMEPGALTEMIRVAGLDGMTGFVNPRSNNATIATLPLHGRVRQSTPHGVRQASHDLSNRLPATSLVPTAVGFCLLVRWKILAEFGGFDEIYGAGYNEENDLVMRAARCGYRAVLANHAFVWHDGEASFRESDLSRDVWERRNRAILDERYPEYSRHTAAFYDAPENLAEHLLACLLPDGEGLLDLALDFSSFRADFNGTFQAGYQILRVAQQVWGDRFRTFVICAEDVYRFHGYAATGIPRVDPHGGRKFAVIFRVGQPYDWNSIERLATSGAVTGLYMLDTISLDCPQLASPALCHLWQFALDHADLIATQSHHTAQQFATRFPMPEHAVRIIAPHSLDLADYALTTAPAPRAQSDLTANILVVGNHFAHKYVAPTANVLCSTFPDRQITVLGQSVASSSPKPSDARAHLVAAPNLSAHQAGTLDQASVDAIYHNADVIVFPSHAEGFGFPLLTALAARKPVFVRRLDVFDEIWTKFGRTANVHFFDSTTDLISQLQKLPRWTGGELSAPPDADAAGSARLLLAGILQALDRANYQRIVARLRALQSANLFAQPSYVPVPGELPADAAARLLAELTQRVARRILAVPVVFRVIRRIVRAGRWWRR